VRYKDRTTAREALLVAGGGGGMMMMGLEGVGRLAVSQELGKIKSRKRTLHHWVQAKTTTIQPSCAAYVRCGSVSDMRW
jgi:hypothetical protein